jgi:hypothetical protein
MTSFLLSFSLDISATLNINSKETKNQGKKMLSPTSQRWPAFLPTQRTVLKEFILNMNIPCCKFNVADSCPNFEKAQSK